MPGVMGKFDLGAEKEAEKSLAIFPRQRTSHSKHSFPKTKVATLHVDITRWSTPNSD